MLRRAPYFAGLVLLFAVAAAPIPNADSGRAVSLSNGSSWLERVNLYRATALLPPVVEDPALSGACCSTRATWCCTASSSIHRTGGTPAQRRKARRQPP